MCWRQKMGTNKDHTVVIKYSETHNLPITGPFSFLESLGFGIHLFMIPKISLLATETQKSQTTAYQIKNDTSFLVKPLHSKLSVSLPCDFTCGLLDSLHYHLQGQTWDLHISLVVRYRTWKEWELVLRRLRLEYRYWYIHLSANSKNVPIETMTKWHVSMYRTFTQSSLQLLLIHDSSWPPGAPWRSLSWPRAPSAPEQWLLQLQIGSTIIWNMG